MNAMKTPVAVSFFVLSGALVSAQDAVEAAKQERPAIQFHVLQGWRADLGDRSIYLNRVAPPVLQTAPVKIQQSNPQTSETIPTRVLVAGKKSEVLFLSATVFDHHISEISWTDGARQWTAFSNVDFNLFGGSATFEIADTVYSLLLVVTNETTGANGLNQLGAPATEKPLSVRKQVPSLEKLSPTQAQYLIAGDESGTVPQAKDLAAMDALHVYFDANRQRLTEEFAKREAEKIAQEQRPKEPPPKPADTIVNFWPGNGSVIIDARRKGVRP